MLNRKAVFPVVLAAAAGVPYLVYEKDLPQAAKAKLMGLVSNVTANEDARPEFRSEFGFGPQAESPRFSAEGGFTGPSIADFGEVFRFDIDPPWVTARWPRVTTVLAETGLEGLRVPLMTGTRLDDLAGTLTYYFDHNHQVQRLAFDGFTGDERRLATLITQYYRLQSEPTLDAGMFVLRWNGKATSVMKISRAPIITADSPHSQLHIQLELNRPNIQYGLSPEYLQMLQGDRNTRRW